MPPYISELSFSTNRVLKTAQLPSKYSNMSSLLSEMMFLKYNKTTEISWYNLKGIIRPELVGSLFFHWSYRQFNGTKVMSVPKRFAHIRHYRSTNKNDLNGDWQTFYSRERKETKLESSFENKLIEAVKRRVKYVYEQRMIRCEEIPKVLYNRYDRNLLDCKFKYE
uniref:Glycosyltransferase family 92 protein n=1 Tax=Caenorhabditis japonica TaxID=281687 RepID=K7HLR2_CAEJA